MARILIVSLCATLVVVIALLFAPWPSADREPAEESSSSRSTNNRSHTLSKDNEQAPSKQPREERTRTEEKKPAPSTVGTHTSGQLNNFIIPNLELEDSSPKEAIAQLLKAYEKICLELGEQPLDISASTNATSDIKITADLSGHSFISAWREIASHASVTLSAGGTELNHEALAGAPSGQTTPPRDIKYATALITSPQELDFLDGQVLSPAELANVMRTASQMPLETQSLPSLILRSGQHAKIRRPGEEEPIVTTSASPYGFGVSAEIVTESEGENETSPVASPPTIVPPGHWLVRTEQTSEGAFCYTLLQPSVVNPVAAPWGIPHLQE